MSDFHLFLGNKNYSSWSFRPWLAMRVANIPFTETVIPFTETEGHNPQFEELSPVARVPVLKAGDLTIWESLAILEFLAERFPEVRLWPEDYTARAKARVISNEMHADFGALRGACPMNMRRKPAAIDVDTDVLKDVARVEQIWEECLKIYGGPFLFGHFTNADAMFAPVVNRLETYKLSNHEAVKEYSAAMKALPAWQEWVDASKAEPWVVPYDEL
ncbi:MAG: glutathione S-transferase family protein [Hyphomicrobiales bacterium]